MASAEASLVSLLTTGGLNPVAALVGSRVYPSVLPQNVIYPAIRYQRISTERSRYRTLDGRAGYARPRFQIDIYASTAAVALQVAQAVYAVLEGFGGTVASLRIDGIATEDEAAEFEPVALEGGAGAYRQRLDVFIPHPE